jgi:DNA repair exonuclease SbcCD ATPase subunit
VDTKEVDDLRNEVAELKKEIEKLKNEHLLEISKKISEGEQVKSELRQTFESLNAKNNEIETLRQQNSKPQEAPPAAPVSVAIPAEFLSQISEQVKKSIQGNAVILW